jgi:membrane-associated phospholipid phosphatase
VIDDIPKLLLALILALVGLLALWGALDQRSPRAALVRRAWRTPRLRRGVAVAVVLLALVVIAEDVLEAEHDEWVLRLDALIIGALAGSPAGLRRAAGLVSHVTGEGLVVVVAGALATLLLRRRRRDALILGAAALGAWGASGLFKVLFLVPRPRAHDMLRIAASYGFPSGHALVTLVTLGTLAWLLPGHGSRRRSLFMLAAWALAVGAGLSRVILAAHWPSDVVAGLGIGALWLVMLPAIVGDPQCRARDAALAAMAAPPR